VRERYGLEPGQLVDLKALIGDRSDNIPGVRGVGEKGGTSMLQEYGDLEGVLEHIDELSTRYQNALRKGREDAYLSRDLARIVCDAPVALDLSQARSGKGFDREEILDIFQTLGFRTLVDRVPASPGGPGSQGQQLLLFGEDVGEATEVQVGEYRLVSDVETLAHLCSRWSQAERLAVDTETTGIDAMSAYLVGISITDQVGEAWYVPVRAPERDRVLDVDVVINHLGLALENEEIVKIGHNLKYDLKVLNQAGFVVRGTLFDTMLAEWVLNPDSALGLKSQAWTRLGIQMTEITELIGTGRDQITMDQVPLAQVVAYASADADITYRLAQILEPELKEREQFELFQDLEMPLLPVLLEMELTGIKLDVDWLQDLSEELSRRLSEIEARVYDYAGEPFNLNSTQQLSEVLFDRLELPTRGVSKTKSGYYSTRAAVLDRLQGEHAIIDDILAYRELSKLQSTYVDALPALVNPETGRVHTSYNPVGTVTGRISSTNPNLQNIPIRTEEGRRVRRAFVAEEGWVLMGADYSQVELRVMAHVSQDPGLIEAFERGEDIHATTAAAIFGVDLEDVTYEMRSTAKTVNFGLIYGQSAFGLARQLGIGVDDARSFIDRYFERFPGVRVYMDQTQAEAAEKGYVETLLKRRRYFPELAPGSRSSTRRRQAAVRMAINTPIQGSAADIIKLAMIRLRGRLNDEGLGARMLLQVHDEVVLEVPEDEEAATSQLVREAMEGATALDVPLKVDVEVGTNWLDMH
jgi:DNA polymerase-1